MIDPVVREQLRERSRAVIRDVEKRSRHKVPHMFNTVMAALCTAYEMNGRLPAKPSTVLDLVPGISLEDALDLLTILTGPDNTEGTYRGHILATHDDARLVARGLLRKVREAGAVGAAAVTA